MFGDDRVNLAPRDDVIDESVARFGDLGVTETRSFEIGDVSTGTGQDPKLAASMRGVGVGVGVEHALVTMNGESVPGPSGPVLVSAGATSSVTAPAHWSRASSMVLGLQPWPGYDEVVRDSHCWGRG